MTEHSTCEKQWPCLFHPEKDIKKQQHIIRLRPISLKAFFYIKITANSHNFRWSLNIFRLSFAVVGFNVIFYKTPVLRQRMK